MRKPPAPLSNQRQKQNIKRIGVLTKGAGFFCFKVQVSSFQFQEKRNMKKPLPRSWNILLQAVLGAPRFKFRTANEPAASSSSLETEH
jgi:hypothetical protein